MNSLLNLNLPFPAALTAMWTYFGERPVTMSAQIALPEKSGALMSIF